LVDELLFSFQETWYFLLSLLLSLSLPLLPTKRSEIEQASSTKGLTPLVIG